MSIRRSDLISTAASAVTAVCAVIVTGMVVATQVQSRSARALVRPVAGKPLATAVWDSLIATGHRSGASNPKVTILEFADFECPFCKLFEDSVLAPFIAAHPTDVAVVFRHWPLRMHRFAYPAARAAECADRQGRFEQFRHALYAHQDSLGLLPFATVAVLAGVRDTAAFDKCDAETGAIAAVDRDASVGKRYGTGTPTVIVNGVPYEGGGPDLPELNRIWRATRS